MTDLNVLDIFSPYLIAATLGYVVAQLCKMIIISTRRRKLSWRVLLQSGGMPSSHSATVVALTTVIGLKNGLGSEIFALAAIFAVVVIYDATHVRRAVGEQGLVLRSIIDRDAKQEKTIADLTPEEDRPGRKFTKPYFSRGHTPIEAVIGGLIGIVIGIVVTILS